MEDEAASVTQRETDPQRRECLGGGAERVRGAEAGVKGREDQVLQAARVLLGRTLVYDKATSYSSFRLIRLR